MSRSSTNRGINSGADVFNLELTLATSALAGGSWLITSSQKPFTEDAVTVDDGGAEDEDDGDEGDAAIEVANALAVDIDAATDANAVDENEVDSNNEETDQPKSPIACEEDEESDGKSQVQLLRTKWATKMKMMTMKKKEKAMTMKTTKNEMKKEMKKEVNHPRFAAST